MRLVIGDVPLLVKLSDRLEIDHVLNPFTPSNYRRVKVVSGNRMIEELGKSLLTVGTNFAVQLLELEGAELANYLSNLVLNILNTVNALSDIDLTILDMLSLFLLDHVDQLRKIEIVLMLVPDTPVPAYRGMLGLVKTVLRKEAIIDDEAINLYVKFNIRSILDLIERAGIIDKVKQFSNVKLVYSLDEAVRFLEKRT
ncbi:MAG: hypothetical protein GXO26_01785 [Crenarchaeota archaeon]|nr:hypothetical protein [Thermoproteota archaeon]